VRVGIGSDFQNTRFSSFRGEVEMGDV